MTTTIALSYRYIKANCKWPLFCDLNDLDVDMYAGEDIIELSFEEADEIGVWSDENEKKRREARVTDEERRAAYQAIMDEMAADSAADEARKLLSPEEQRHEVWILAGRPEAPVYNDCIDCKHRAGDANQIPSSDFFKGWPQQVKCRRFKTTKWRSNAERCEEYIKDSEKNIKKYKALVDKEIKRLKQ